MLLSFCKKKKCTVFGVGEWTGEKGEVADHFFNKESKLVMAAKRYAWLQGVKVENAWGTNV
jgi:hypothetical protein